MKKFLSPAERGEMASVELVSKSEDGGCPPAPCHAPSRKLKPWFTFHATNRRALPWR